MAQADIMHQFYIELHDVETLLDQTKAVGAATSDLQLEPATTR
jgi:hypothetical protein